MTITYEELVEASGGEMCGGDVIARVDGKLVVLGQKRGAVFNLTPAGEAFVETIPAKPVKAEKPAKAAKAEAKAQEIKVDLTSDASLQDMLS